MKASVGHDSELGSPVYWSLALYRLEEHREKWGGSGTKGTRLSMDSERLTGTSKVSVGKVTSSGHSHQARGLILGSSVLLFRFSLPPLPGGE